MEKLNTTNLIYEQMTLDNPPRERKLRHYPSGLPYYENGIPQGKCKRALVYAMLGIEESHHIDPVALFKMDIGNIIHDKTDEVLTKALKRVYGDDFNVEDKLLQDYIAEANDRILAEANLNNIPEDEVELIDVNGAEVPMVWKVDGLEMPMSGRMDKVININGKRGVCEWKSTYGYGVNYIKKEGPKLEAMIQARAYMDNPYIPLDFIILTYIARDSGYMFGYYIEFGETHDDMVLYHMNSSLAETRKIEMSEIVRACAEVEQYVKNEEIPDRDYHVNVNPKTNTLVQKGGDWNCRYCNYRGICYGVDN